MVRTATYTEPDEGPTSHLPTTTEGWIGGIFAAMVLLTGIILWQGYIVSWLWFWHIVPTFGLDPISYKSAVGLIVFAHAVLRPGNTITNDQTSPSKTLFWAFAGPGFYLALGYFAKCWVQAG